MLFLDLDGFKDVNDRHGHAAGDSVLVQVAERLRATLRTTDHLCPTGGGEFVAVLPDLDPIDAARVASDITAVLQRPFVAGSAVLTISGSVGVAMYRDGSTADELLALADHDMYRAKNVGSRTSAPS